MKLVDILARELKVWPDDSWAAVGQSNVGSLHEVHPPESQLRWTGEKYSMASDWTKAEVTRAQWQAAVDALKADEYHEPDNGVEAWLHGIERDYGNDAAQQCRVIIIEAELKRARSKACDNMFGVILSLPEDRQNNRSDICEALYDAGYRKFEIVDN